jgi:hypothetical protein
MTEPDVFSVGILGSDGHWPSLPQSWSYSSLRETEECPRRWALSRASYPEIWDGWGYPPNPTLSALVGDVVHGVLEVLVNAFRSNGCMTSTDPAVVGVIRGLGGYTKLVEDGIDLQLAKLANNPRIKDRLAPLQTTLRLRVPDIRQRVQAIIARTPFFSAGRETPSPYPPTGRQPLALGTHPEVDLHAPDLKLAGRVDLIAVTESACEITDYKTGEADAHHADQLRLYALIWSRDADLNPDNVPVTRLVLSYPTADVDVDPPSQSELDGLAGMAVERISQAEQAVQERPPPARPSDPMCTRCGVRHLCGEYWAFLKKAQGTLIGTDSEWFDCEGVVTEQNGPRSWHFLTEPDGGDLLLRTAVEVVPFQSGDRLRLLNLRRDIDPESNLSIGSLTHASEIFVLSGSG